MAPEVEPGAPGAYGGSGSIDGKVPGRLWINLRTTEIWPRYALPDLAYHETIPGHVWQGEYTHKLPLVRSLLAFNAYSEGWALYGEQLADELGVYDANPVERLGYLQSLAFRACRLVVDTGIHSKRWTRGTRDRLVRDQQRFDGRGSVGRGRPLLQLARPGVRLQGRPHDDQHAAPEGQGRTGRAVRFPRVQRCRRARRSGADDGAWRGDRPVCGWEAGLTGGERLASDVSIGCHASPSDIKRRSTVTVDVRVSDRSFGPLFLISIAVVR